MSALDGFGLGLRPPHYQDILDGAPGADWFEITSENYMVGGGRSLANLWAIRDRYPMIMHGVSLSIGTTDPIDLDYLDRLAELARRLEPAFVSDHFCWTGVAGRNSHDLLPLPLTEEALAHVCSRVDRVQERLGRAIALENTSTYVTFAESTIPEWEFNVAVARATGCKLLLDVNNVHVSAVNHGFDAGAFIDFMPRDLVAYIHLAGHEDNGSHLVDTHDHPVADPVWALYRRAIQRLGPVPSMIERDDKIPPFAELVGELDRAREAAAAAASGSRIFAA